MNKVHERYPQNRGDGGREWGRHDAGYTRRDDSGYHGRNNFERRDVGPPPPPPQRYDVSPPQPQQPPQRDFDRSQSHANGGGMMPRGPVGGSMRTDWRGPPPPLPPAPRDSRMHDREVRDGGHRPNPLLQHERRPKY